MSYSVFISYEHGDRKLAYAFCAYLEKNGVPCWIAPRDIPAGRKFAEAIVSAIESVPVFLVILSKKSNESEFVLRELKTAVDAKCAIVPVLSEAVDIGKDMGFFLGTAQRLTAYPGPLGKHLPLLLQAIRSFLQERTSRKASAPERNRRMTFALKGLMAAILLFAVGAGLVELRRPSRPSVDELISLMATTPTTSANRIEMVNASKEIAHKCWDVMWGPDEDSFLAQLATVSPKLHDATAWAVSNDPRSAVTILGNGHRLLSKLPEFWNWVAMTDALAAAPLDRSNRDFGRLLCGVAYGHWQDDPTRGFKAAKEALKLFEQIPQSDSDQANAWRMIGLCAPANQKLPYYERSLEIYRRIGEERGTAHALLSEAQSGGDEIEGMYPATESAEIFNSLRNHAYFKEALGQALDGEALHSSIDTEHGGIRRRLRRLVIAESEFQLRLRNVDGYYEALAKAIGVDLRIPDPELALRDFEAVLKATMEPSPVGIGNHYRLFGTYLEACEKLKVSPDGVIVKYFNRMATQQEIAAGRKLSIEEAMRALVDRRVWKYLERTGTNAI